MVVSCVKSIIENLGAYLLENMEDLNQVLYEFPAANVNLKYPSLSIVPGNPQFTPTAPYLLSQGPVVDHQTTIKTIMGSYDLNLQLDLWTRDKIERFKLQEQFFAAFNPNPSCAGLSLQMADYHNLWCRYDYNGYNQSDGEPGAQRAEWRQSILIVANTRAVVEQTIEAIETIENSLSLPDNIAND